jgi:hypothetical protein
MTTPTPPPARLAARVAPRPFLALCALIALPGLFAMACSSGGGSGSDSSSSSGAGGNGSPDAGTPDASIGDSSVLVGTFQVRLVPPVPASGNSPEVPGYTSVLGKIYDGPTPSQIVWEKAGEEGACQLLTPRVPFCSQPCGGSAVCVEDETCKDYPIAHSAGKVTAKGFRTAAGPTEFTMSPVANSYQLPAGVSLPYPAFDEGQELSLSASGEYYSAFSLKAPGISPLVLLNDSIVIETGKAVKLSWTPPGKAGISKIHVKLDISHHGGTKGMIECDADDTGSLDLPASLLGQLTDLGVAGFPSIIVSRRATGSATIAPGRVDLIVSSDVEHAVEIPGVTSCTDSSQCPNGQTCQADLTCK